MYVYKADIIRATGRLRGIEICRYLCTIVCKLEYFNYTFTCNKTWQMFFLGFLFFTRIHFTKRNAEASSSWKRYQCHVINYASDDILSSREMLTKTRIFKIFKTAERNSVTYLIHVYLYIELYICKQFPLFSFKLKDIPSFDENCISRLLLFYP